MTIAITYDDVMTMYWLYSCLFSWWAAECYLDFWVEDTKEEAA